MRNSKVLERWSCGEAALCTCVTFTDPAVTELVSLLGFDCIWLDLEHHLASVETIGQMMRGARVGGADVMARPAKGELARLSRLLEGGAQGILYPRCEVEADAVDAVRWAKFAPLGERGFDGGNPDMPYGSMSAADYVRMANEQTFLLCQIESPAAMGHSRAIAEVDGVDGLFFGPGDYSVLSGVAGQVEGAEVTAAMQQVCGDALAAGKRFGTLVFSVEQAQRVLDMGATFVCYRADLTLLKAGLLEMRDQFAALGFSFDSRIDGPGSAYSS